MKPLYREILIRRLQRGTLMAGLLVLGYLLGRNQVLDDGPIVAALRAGFSLPPELFLH